MKCEKHYAKIIMKCPKMCRSNVEVQKRVIFMNYLQFCEGSKPNNLTVSTLE